MRIGAKDRSFECNVCGKRVDVRRERHIMFVDPIEDGIAFFHDKCFQEYLLWGYR